MGASSSRHAATDTNTSLLKREQQQITGQQQQKWIQVRCYTHSGVRKLTGSTEQQFRSVYGCNDRFGPFSPNINPTFVSKDFATHNSLKFMSSSNCSTAASQPMRHSRPAELCIVKLSEVGATSALPLYHIIF